MQSPFSRLYPSACVLVLTLCTLAYGQGTARFEGEIKTKWLSDGRKMELLDDFTYVDAAGKKWRAKRGSVIDGATIPQVFWSTGGPYEGRHRDASVVHDFYCDPLNRTERWAAVHRMFYEALLTNGVATSRALVYYGAVYRHGPRWPDPRRGRGGAASPADTPSPPPPPQTSTPIDADVRMLEEKVANGTITSPEDIERLPE